MQASTACETECAANWMDYSERKRWLEVAPNSFFLPHPLQNFLPLTRLWGSIPLQASVCC